MALKILDPIQPPEFSILDFIKIVNEDLYAEGVSPLHKFEFDSKHVPVAGIWRPSGLRRCMRKQVYKACRVERVRPPFDAAKQFMFDRGHVFGAWMAAYVSALEGRHGFTVVSCEVELHHEGTQIGGKADVVVSRGGHKYVVEIKSKDNAAAMRKISPAKTDLSQLNDYMAMSGAQAGWLVYFGVDFVNWVPNSTKPPRTTISAKEFFHRFSHRMWQETEKKVQMLTWFLRDQTKLAPKTTNTMFECSNCEWKWACDKELTPTDAKAES